MFAELHPYDYEKGDNMGQKVKLKDGREVTVREIASDDVDRSHTFFRDLPADDRAYLRVDVTDRKVVEDRIRTIDRDRIRRLVAVHGDEIVADGTLESDGLQWDDHLAELRLIVARPYQRHGLGMLMARELYFLAARKKKWALAGMLGAVASATRIVGIFLFPALVWQWWQGTQGTKKPKLKNFFPLVMICLGLFLYMYYLYKTVGDPLFFFHVQPFFGAERSGDKIILLYQVFWRYFKMLLTVEKISPIYFTVVLEAITGFGFLFLPVFAYLRKWFSYVIFMSLAYIAPTLTGTFSSLPRYVLILFPGFMLLAIWAEKYHWLKKAYVIFCLPFLVLSLWLFFRGYFVA